jgi:hypothetical protein
MSIQRKTSCWPPRLEFQRRRSVRHRQWHRCLLGRDPARREPSCWRPVEHGLPGHRRPRPRTKWTRWRRRRAAAGANASPSPQGRSLGVRLGIAMGRCWPEDYSLPLAAETVVSRQRTACDRFRPSAGHRPRAIWDRRSSCGLCGRAVTMGHWMPAATHRSVAARTQPHHRGRLPTVRHLSWMWASTLMTILGFPP